MKLIGSNLEKQAREELERSHQSLFYDEANSRLLNSIKSEFPDMHSAYVLDWVPEQGEDIFTVLVDSDAVAIFELTRSGCEVAKASSVKAVSDYQDSLRRNKQVKLLVALQLVSEKNGAANPYLSGKN